MRKSQMTMEVVFVVGVILFMFLLLAAAVYEKRTETSKTSSALNKLSLCHEVANNIAAVYNGGDGATARITSLYYNVSINPKSKVIAVINKDDRDDFVTCTIPVEKVLYYDTVHGYYNGSIEGYVAQLQGYNTTNAFYSNFNINTTSIQLENIDGRVFINSKCNINEVDVAEAQSSQGFNNPVTLPIKRFDDDTIEIISGTREETPGEGQYLFNVAYAQLGGEQCIEAVLDSLGYTGSDDCTAYQSPSCSSPQTKCDIFKSTSVIDKCLFNPSQPAFTDWYNIIIFEDVQNLDAVELSVFEQRISGGAWALISGDGVDSEAFGAYLHAGVPPSNQWASLVQQDPEGMLPTLTTTTLQFTGTGSSKNSFGLINYYALYTFDPPYSVYDAVSRWKYPDTGDPHGDVYYFNNYCDLQSELTELLRNILSVNYFTYIYADFRISRTIQESLQANNPISLLVAHNIENPSFASDYAWIGEISWCDLDNDPSCASWNTIEIDENGYKEGTTEMICENSKAEYNKPKVAKCTFELDPTGLIPDIHNIRVRIKFINAEGAGQAPITVDFVQLEGCHAE